MRISTATMYAMVLAAFSTGSLAQSCPALTSQLNQTELSNAFSGKTLCMSRGSERWQEFHALNFDLIDFKLGAGHPVDPTEKVGTWRIDGQGSNAVLTHVYNGGGSYSWLVCGVSKNPPFTLVSTGGSGTITNGVMLSGQSACP